MILTKYNSEIWAIANVLDIDICNDCITASVEDNLFPNSLNEVHKDIITSFKNRVFLTSPELANIVWNNIYDKVPQNHQGYEVYGINEGFRFYKYLTDQEFTMHQDIDFEKSAYEKSFYSLLIYLNDNFKGGETTFENLSVKPIAGSALVFPHVLFHSGAKVIEGIKYVLRSDIMYKKI
jgi:prolyl 4-hydroxylase